MPHPHRRPRRDETRHQGWESDCTRAPKPPLLSPRQTDTTTVTDRKTFSAEHRQVWFEYYLDQAVEIYGVASTDAQYLAKLEMDYVGFAEETTQTMLAHLHTQPIVLNKEKECSAEISSACGQMHPT